MTENKSLVIEYAFFFENYSPTNGGSVHFLDYEATAFISHSLFVRSFANLSSAAVHLESANNTIQYSCFSQCESYKIRHSYYAKAKGNGQNKAEQNTIYNCPMTESECDTIALLEYGTQSNTNINCTHSKARTDCGISFRTNIPLVKNEYLTLFGNEQSMLIFTDYRKGGNSVDSYCNIVNNTNGNLSDYLFSVSCDRYTCNNCIITNNIYSELGGFTCSDGVDVSLCHIWGNTFSTEAISIEVNTRVIEHVELDECFKWVLTPSFTVKGAKQDWYVEVRIIFCEAM